MSVKEQQGSLFDPEPEREQAYAKRDDPGTSWEAARSIDPNQLRAREQAVLRVMKVYGPLHNDAIIVRYREHTGAWSLPSQTDQSIRSRRSELTVKGLVIDTGDKVVLASGRRAVVWRAIDHKWVEKE